MPLRRATEAVSAPRRLALATMWHFAAPGNFSKGACGLLKWCFSASQLAALPYMRAQHTDVLVVTNDPSFVAQECAAPTKQAVPPRAIAPDPSVLRLVRQWSAARCRQGVCQRGGMANAAHAGLLRLQFFAMAEYSAVLVTDLDVALFLMHQGRPPRPGGAGARRLERAWTHELGEFLASNTLLMARPDHHSPINTAALLLKPLPSAFALLRRVLEGGVFDADLGFNRTGRPQQALAASPAAALASLKPSTARALNKTVFWRHNDWRFIGGDGLPVLPALPQPQTSTRRRTLPHSSSPLRDRRPGPARARVHCAAWRLDEPQEILGGAPLLWRRQAVAAGDALL